MGHMEFLSEVGDPGTGEPIGNTVDNLRSAVYGDTHEYTEMFPRMAEVAREEGFDDAADWFETVGAASRLHAARFQRALDEIQE